MARFHVHTAIVLRGSRDPEGETILRDLVLASGARGVSSIWSGKYLRFTVESRDGAEAVELVRKICMELRIYNPSVHELVILGVEDA
jgi:phosphoribosylformylglycinamidine (FGAM) synthase PurS component